MTDTLLSAARETINEGVLVMVSYPLSDKTNNPAKKLDGMEFTVRNKHLIREARNTRAIRHYFELAGAVSDFGIHYGFCEDELIKL